MGRKYGDGVGIEFEEEDTKLCAFGENKKSVLRVEAGRRTIRFEKKTAEEKVGKCFTNA